MERGRTRIVYSTTGVIRVSAWAFNEHTLLHELAHLVTVAEDAYHGAPFVRNYLDLVGLFMAYEYRERLEGALLSCGVVAERAPEAAITAAAGGEDVLRQLRDRQATLRAELAATQARISRTLGARLSPPTDDR